MSSYDDWKATDPDEPLSDCHECAICHEHIAEDEEYLFCKCGKDVCNECKEMHVAEHFNEMSI